ncbi:hypothetical protein DDR33_00540 [Pararcticibacter amylolyticus]|uniref:Adenylosuccinate synthetase n=2 Tax=Pararcticibacter amylolyticus TaxID=2173175 RepID=A0A2U2PM99_9SPHI|nr:hypothetical protein DDR33_00540 [Pararcticibacter amylolyticus]
MHLMKSVLKKVFYTLLFLGFSVCNSFAVNVADSDISNTAGSNSGHINISPFILVVLFLLLAATAPLYTKNRKDI